MFSGKNGKPRFQAGQGADGSPLAYLSDIAGRHLMGLFISKSGEPSLQFRDYEGGKAMHIGTNKDSMPNIRIVDREKTLYTFPAESASRPGN